MTERPLTDVERAQVEQQAREVTARLERATRELDELRRAADPDLP